MATERKPLPYMGREEASSCCSGWLYLFKQSTCWRRGGWMKQGISSPPPPPPPHCSALLTPFICFRALKWQIFTQTPLKQPPARQGRLSAVWFFFSRTKIKIFILTRCSVKLIQEGDKRLFLMLVVDVTLEKHSLVSAPLIQRFTRFLHLTSLLVWHSHTRTSVHI